VSERSKRPTHVAEALASYLERSGLAEKVEAAAVIPDWAPRVGEKIAEATRPLHVSGDTLVVAVRSSAWMMELKMMESQILRRLNAGRKRGRIEHLRFVMDPD
jgi:predicted nucleic acid-binding Zn ribbon protein